MQPETPSRGRAREAVVALDPDAAWAIAFRDSLNSDALMQVVLQGIDNAKKTSKTALQLHEPGGTGLVSWQPRPDHFPDQGRPARCWPESSSASSASSRTGRSASSSCLPNRYGYAIPAMAAPISGASQNTQSCAGAPLPLKNATPSSAPG